MHISGRKTVVVGGITIQGPVAGQRCPACGNIDTIFREVVPHRTRMRCGECNCQFPGQWPSWLRFLASGAFLSMLALAGLWGYQQRAQLLAWLMAWWQRDPALVAVLGGVAVTAVLVALLVAVYPRRKLSVNQPGK